MSDPLFTSLAASNHLETFDPHAPVIRPKTITDSLNRSLHDLRISVIDRCNFRCTYCMPAEEYDEKYSFLHKEDWLTFDEITRLARLFVSLGTSKIRITGGEPLLRENLSELIFKLKAIDGLSDLAMTTNGILLKNSAQKLFDAGLKRLTVSLDTLDDATFRRLNGNKAGVMQVLKGIKAAEEAGFRSIKINAVVQKGINDTSVLKLVEHFKGSGHILRFIEYMDVGNRNHWKPELVVPSLAIAKLIHGVFPIRPIMPNYHGEVAERYAFEDGTGEIGFISSITQPFCGTCTRARISTDGKFYTCLFAGSGFDLKSYLRGNVSDEEFSIILENIWKVRSDRYSETRLQNVENKDRIKKIEMYQIGG